MKKKILSLLAAFFMLFGTSAMAQVDSTLEGDVNGDGVVDIADITAVIAIIKQNAEASPTYYWYAGQTEPTSMTSNPTPSSEFTCNNWFEIGTTLPTSIVQRVTGGTSGNAWYAAMPTAAGLVAGTSADPDTSITKIKNITINGVKYDVWYAGGVTATRFNLNFNK